MNKSLVFAGITPHPPIMVPEVGREEIVKVRSSIEAMQDFTRRVIESGAESIIIISPHAPLHDTGFVAYSDSQLRGSFSRFGAPEVKTDAPLDRELFNIIASTSKNHGYDLIPLENHYLDHGTTVPLYFLQQNGWVGRIVALGYSYLSNKDHLNFGAAIKRAIDKIQRPIALVASGDLSHRLIPEAPAGYYAEAYRFDKEIITGINTSNPDRIINVDQELRKKAGECGYRSVLIALGATKYMTHECEVLSYEAPFGVGYLVAQLVCTAGKAQSTENKLQSQTLSTNTKAITALARKTVETFVREGRVITVPDEIRAELNSPGGCFVSVKTKSGDLRGCIGTIDPIKDSLANEIISNAISAASKDPRFTPITEAELKDLVYSVDILMPPEPAKFEDLNPKIYGIIVEEKTGENRGLLLPDIPGVETAKEQLDITLRKAGISPGSEYNLYRFRVNRFSEPKQAWAKQS
jgi:MEMO1 family protein